METELNRHRFPSPTSRHSVKHFTTQTIFLFLYFIIFHHHHHHHPLPTATTPLTPTHTSGCLQHSTLQKLHFFFLSYFPLQSKNILMVALAELDTAEQHWHKLFFLQGFLQQHDLHLRIRRGHCET